MNQLPLILAVLVGAIHLMAANAQAAASTWPQWRGPDRDGLVSGPAWPEKLDTNHLREVWRAELGPSYSGPIVGADRVFTTETKDKKLEIVTAFDRSTGKQLWRAQWEGAISASSARRWLTATPFTCRPPQALYASTSSRAKSSGARWRTRAACGAAPFRRP